MPDNPDTDSHPTKRGGARKGAGRPPKEGGAMRPVALRLPPDVADALEADRAGAREALTRWAKRSRND